MTTVGCAGDVLSAGRAAANGSRLWLCYLNPKRRYFPEHISCARAIDEHRVAPAGISGTDDRCPLPKSPMPANDVRRAATDALRATVEMFQKRAG
jgi:hypothetical protein